MKLSFSEADSDAANEQWGANCGPHAVAAALNLSLDQVRPHFAAFEQKFKERGYGFTNPTMMGNALALAGQSVAIAKGLKTKELREGISRIQWLWIKSAPRLHRVKCDEAILKHAVGVCYYRMHNYLTGTPPADELAQPVEAAPELQSETA